MKTLTLALTFVLALSFTPAAFARGEKAAAQIHRDLCQVAATDYAKAVPSPAACLASTKLKTSREDLSISFLDCTTGEIVTIWYTISNGRILTDSTDAEDDLCG